METNRRWKQGLRHGILGEKGHPAVGMGRAMLARSAHVKFGMKILVGKGLCAMLERSGNPCVIMKEKIG